MSPHAFAARRGLPLALALGILALAGDIQAQQVSTPPQRGITLTPGDTVLATPDSRYDAGLLQRTFMGDGWRELWALPVEAQVLDLGEVGGGLTPLRVGGGYQTPSLRFRGEDGQRWTFRSLDKDPVRALDPVLRGTLFATAANDRISAIMPLGALVVTSILDDAGILNPGPQLVVMPDDERLGEYRERFAGMLGWIEIRPDEGEDGEPGFEGSTRVVGSERLLERLEDDPRNQVDARAYLRARLLDFLVGDWDRHPDQWRWAGFERDGQLVFDPIPRDRDWAFSRLGGIQSLLTYYIWPHYVSFGPRLPNMARLSWSGRTLDRRVLSKLNAEDFDAELAWLMDTVNEDVLRSAVRKLPDAYYDEIGSTIEGWLLERRRQLPEATRDFYRILAKDVDLHATDEEDVARIERREDGSVRLTIAEEDSETAPWFDRTFLPNETNEIRLDMHGDQDIVEVFGASAGPIKLLIDGGGSRDRIRDQTSGRNITVFSRKRDDDLYLGRRASVDGTRWREPVDPEDNPHYAIHRNWGRSNIGMPLLRAEPGLGLLVGASLEHRTYGYRQYPYRSRYRADVGLATQTMRPWVRLTADLPFVGGLRLHPFLESTGSDEDRFYGFGNDSRFDRPADQFIARRDIYGAGATVATDESRPFGVELGVAYQHFLTTRDETAGTFIEETAPFGWGDFEQFVFTGALRWSRMPEDPHRSGFELEASGRFGPELLDIASPFGRGTIAASGRLAGGGSLEPTLRLTAGGTRVWGDFPVHEAAYLGGGPNLRGFRNNRFAGDGALWLDTEFRVALANITLLLPGRFGLTGIADTGRVFFDSTDSNRWHTAFGGGAWIRWLESYTLTVSVARSDEFTGLYASLELPVN